MEIGKMKKYFCPICNGTCQVLDDWEIEKWGTCKVLENGDW